MEAAAIIQARIGSTRFPGKALVDVAGTPLIAHVIKRVSGFKGLKKEKGLVLAIPDRRSDNELARIGRDWGAEIVRGDEDDVLGRILLAADFAGADVIFRITGDNPLVDPGVAELTLNAFESGRWDYSVMEEVPLGTTSEIIRVDALKRASELATSPRLREHVTLAMYENSHKFRMNLIQAPEKWRHPEWRLTVDTEHDLKVIESILGALGQRATLDEIVPFLEKNPELTLINSEVEQKEYGWLKEMKDAIRRV